MKFVKNFANFSSNFFCPDLALIAEKSGPKCNKNENFLVNKAQKNLSPSPEITLIKL